MEKLSAAVTATPGQRAPAPFRFHTSFILQEATGLRAATLPQLARLLRDVPEGCLYHHTHYFVLQHHYLTPEPTNDFTYWVREVLGEQPLAERLANLDIMQYSSLEALREALVGMVETHLRHHPLARFRFAPEGEEFFFIKSIHVVMPTQYTAGTLEELAQTLQHISLYSLYFHVFDARLRLGQPTNDFARWLEQQLGEAALAREIAALDPYAHTLDGLRAILISLIRARLSAPALPSAEPPPAPDA